MERVRAAYGTAAADEIGASAFPGAPMAAASPVPQRASS
jgi:hypothetical protein